MAYTSVIKKEIKSIVKEGLREVLSAEIMKLRAAFFPFVSEREQKDIERMYKRPSQRPVKSYNVEV